MSAASRLKFLYLAYASAPKAERFLYRAIRKGRMSRIVEFGLTSLARSRRLIEVSQRYAISHTVCFTGIDPFESAPADSANHPPSRSLIEVFRSLKPTGASVRLLPGELPGVLADAANTLPGTDLMIIGHTVPDDDLAGAWFYLPRMLHPGSLVLREVTSTECGRSFEQIPLMRIHGLAAHRPRSAA